jgi:hypothetical protein
VQLWKHTFEFHTWKHTFGFRTRMCHLRDLHTSGTRLTFNLVCVFRYSPAFSFGQFKCMVCDKLIMMPKTHFTNFNPITVQGDNRERKNHTKYIIVFYRDWNILPKKVKKNAHVSSDSFQTLPQCWTIVQEQNPVFTFFI